jgi:hypothetical protein
MYTDSVVEVIEYRGHVPGGPLAEVVSGPETPPPARSSAPSHPPWQFLSHDPADDVARN